MMKRRSSLIGLTVAAMLGLSSTALAAAPTTGVQPTAGPVFASSHATAPHGSRIRVLSFNHIHAPYSTINMRGQVVSKVQGVAGALAGVTVKVYRHFNASKPWIYVGSATTSSGAVPEFQFATPAVMDATYKIVFEGDDTFRPSEKVTWVSVYRNFNGVITDGKSAATLSGHVDPFYQGKPISLQKRSCATCDYVTIKTAHTGSGGSYSFSLTAPPSGRWWWRLMIPGMRGFITSYGAAYSTQQI